MAPIGVTQPQHFAFHLEAMSTVANAWKASYGLDKRALMRMLDHTTLDHTTMRTQDHTTVDRTAHHRTAAVTAG
jgi:hypothetical protein